MSLRRSARNSTALAAKTNGISPSASSATKKRTDGGDVPPQNQRKRVKKASPRDGAVAESSTFKVPPVPATPTRKRSAKTAQPPHLTPTPSLVGLMRTQYSSGDIDDATPPPSGSTVVFSSHINPIAFCWYLPDSRDPNRRSHVSCVLFPMRLQGPLKASTPAADPARRVPLHQGSVLTIAC
jgi:hypothetical protein